MGKGGKSNKGRGVGRKEVRGAKRDACAYQASRTSLATRSRSFVSVAERKTLLASLRVWIYAAVAVAGGLT